MWAEAFAWLHEQFPWESPSPTPCLSISIFDDGDDDDDGDGSLPTRLSIFVLLIFDYDDRDDGRNGESWNRTKLIDERK